MSNIFLPFRPKKNTSFRFYFSTNGHVLRQHTAWSPNSRIPVEYPIPFSDITFSLSKDGDSFNSLTNVPVTVSAGNGYVDFTAEEMNANIIQMSCQKLLGGNPGADYNISLTFTIFTSGFSGFVSNTVIQPAGLTTAIVELIDRGYNLNNIAIDESGYNYYGLVRNRNPWYVIVREKTDFTEIMYFANNIFQQSFANAWTNRATLNYTSSFPF